MSELNVKLVAADRDVWGGQATQVVARTTEGDIGVLPGHTPLLSTLVSGQIKITDSAGTNHEVTIDSGFMSVDKNVVTIVVEHIEADTLTA